MLSISPAGPHEREAAFRLAFQHLPVDSILEKRQRAEDMIATGELDADAIWLVRDSIGPAGAMIAAPLPGSGAAIFPPQGRPSLHNPAAVLDPLVGAATHWLRQRGVKLAQALLMVSELAAAAPLERSGFTCITRLLYLRHFLDLSADEIARTEQLEYRTVDAVPANVLENTLLRTYAGTLDCPELNLHRSAAEALAGHRGPGQFDASRWWVAFANDEPIALLLCNQCEDSTWDIAYLGVAPEGRRRGYGRDLVHHALFEAKADDMLTVTLTVDERNHPARALYRKSGFEPFDEKCVFLWTASA
jgi:ribosomal protein S18 acetylase RimI-like enzyme